ncbi:MULTISPECIES: hypothetical protein [unclassified Campylobacter]|uniref:hypothetical protein n=1 Tax=unclassified Campylobacter TaxID=2593542 RepID=UPI0022E99CBE|nr:MULTISPECIES: hypothetical protein [unclassified Campylobacter]MDA3056365.1 hypothetical protein [Campylobacter sp. CN_NA1]MDA3065504.1 hypothetical protein [Campylobacter sp. CN_NE4]MDA3068878.1 hypothetical protein [Campylobacter sp. CN_NE3]MDA3082957.1 hypothetical protein [Campylobacter sp. CN_EL2]MDA3084463.1 hypothetical protein [Campylobacter sp. CN_NE1]
MFFWGYIEDVKREVVTDFNISAEPIRTTTTTSVGASSMDAYTHTSGGRISSKTKHATIWTFDIGDTSFKLISDTMSLKNGDFVVVESYSRDGAYYLAYCILNATKKYSEPSWFPGGYLNKRNLPQKPRMIADIGMLCIFVFILFISGLALILIMGEKEEGVKAEEVLSGLIAFGIIFWVPSYFLLGRRAYNAIKDANYQYKRKLSDITKLNNWVEYRNAEYKKYENEIFSALENEGFLPKKEENKQIQS